MKTLPKFVFLLSFLAFQTAFAGIKVGLVLDKGGKDDKSFNSAAYSGAQKAEKELGILLKTVEATDENAFEPMLREFAKRNYDLIISIGFAQAEAVKKVSAQFPNSKFAIVDGKVEAPNVRSILFEEQEGSYLVGALAALKSTSGKVGFIGGMDIPLIRRFQKGYEAGVLKINPKAKVTINYIGVTGTAWNDPPKAKELALSQFQSGVEVIFAAAGASNSGVFDAAEEKKRFAIGVDSNQNWIKPGFILTSMMKSVDVSVYQTCKDVSDGKFTGGVNRFGLANNGVNFAMDSNNEKLITPDMLKKVNALKADIISGKIQVPDYYKLKKN